MTTRIEQIKNQYQHWITLAHRASGLQSQEMIDILKPLVQVRRAIAEIDTYAKTMDSSELDRRLSQTEISLRDFDKKIQRIYEKSQRENLSEWVPLVGVAVVIAGFAGMVLFGKKR